MTAGEFTRARETFNTDVVHLSRDEAHALASAALATIVLEPEHAGIIADHLVDAELCGYPFAGLSRVITVARGMARRPPPVPVRVVHEAPVSAVVDGGGNCGYVAVFQGMELARRKATEQGFAIVTVNNTYFSGRGAYYVERLAEAGLVGIHVAAAHPTVAPYGGRTPMLGTNPIALAVPGADGPLVFDMGTSVLMHGEIELAERTGAVLPPGGAIDAAGQPTTDPAAALDGAILPFGGYKGYGLALLIQAFGLLSRSQECRGQVNDFGFVHLAFAPGLTIEPDEFRQQVSRLVDEVRGTPPLGAGPVRIPGERSRHSRERALREGIDVDRAIVAGLEEMCRTGRPAPASADGSE
ncbi:MAG TPA: Ldh family oxidoreductase [Streptosporangiaceae bacterium]|jgi:LDH2 family malate/lactate/ureidoglycolate dehydrogenase|nr:Ldh family oxidoreductase [Streptosporangiaceae bacterium]